MHEYEKADHRKIVKIYDIMGVYVRCMAHAYNSVCAIISTSRVVAVNRHILFETAPFKLGRLARSLIHAPINPSPLALHACSLLPLPTFGPHQLPLFLPLNGNGPPEALAARRARRTR